MPFYIRKSISAGPFRFNLSRSGVGLSVGVKGFVSASVHEVITSKPDVVDCTIEHLSALLDSTKKKNSNIRKSKPQAILRSYLTARHHPLISKW